MSGKRILAGFVAGFVAVLLFHQTMVLILHAAGVAAVMPWNMAPVPPLGVPAVVSAAFWGGIWGIMMAWLLPRFRGAGYWVFALVFGAVALTAVAGFVVAPIKGMPMGFGFDPFRALYGLAVNGAWGVGTALLLRLIPGAMPRPA
jgi:hypothetical protein